MAATSRAVTEASWSAAFIKLVCAWPFGAGCVTESFAHRGGECEQSTRERLSAHVAVSPSVEGVATATRRGHARSSKGNTNARQENEHHADAECFDALIELKCPKRGMVCGERRGARGIVRHTWTLQTQNER
eukprot:scaffold25972_cov32-Tisochrysis_lutea.AAC.3